MVGPSCLEYTISILSVSTALPDDHSAGLETPHCNTATTPSQAPAASRQQERQHNSLFMCNQLSKLLSSSPIFGDLIRYVDITRSLQYLTKEDKICKMIALKLVLQVSKRPLEIYHTYMLHLPPSTALSSAIWCTHMLNDKLQHGGKKVLANKGSSTLEFAFFRMHLPTNAGKYLEVLFKGAFQITLICRFQVTWLNNSCKSNEFILKFFKEKIFNRVTRKTF